MRVRLVEDDPSASRLIVFDNVQAIAPKEEESIGLFNVVKSERITQWLCRLVDEFACRDQSPKICLVTRHYSLINQRLLEIGYFDTLIEVQAPTKEQRYSFVKNQLAPLVDSKASSSLSTKEIKL